MVEKILTSKQKANKAFVLYDRDEQDNIHTNGVAVDDGNYDNGTFKDRDYDVRDYKSIAINLENIGANAVKYKVQSTTKHFDNLDNDLVDDDFDKEEKAETEIAAGSKATGSVEVTGGPSVAASGTLTIASAVAETKATGTITCASVQAGDTVTVNGLVYTAVSGTKADNTEFDISGTDDAAATDLADSITNDTRTGTLGDVTATAASNVVTCTSDEEGADGNSVTLTSSNGTRLAVSGSGTFTGGVTADKATVNGLVYTAVDGTKADNTEFDVSGTDAQAAADLADSITNDTRTPVTVPGIDVTASDSTNVVTVTAPVNDGADGNAIDISGTANITASAATLENGVTSDITSITVGGVEILGATIRWRDNVTNTASDIADQINSITSSPNYTAQNSSGVVTITAVDNEANTGTVTSTTNTMTTTDSNMSGGASGKSDLVKIIRDSPSITAIRLRAKESAAGSPGKIRANIKASKS